MKRKSSMWLSPTPSAVDQFEQNNDTVVRTKLWIVGMSEDVLPGSSDSRMRMC